MTACFVRSSPLARRMPLAEEIRQHWMAFAHVLNAGVVNVERVRFAAKLGSLHNTPSRAAASIIYISRKSKSRP